MQGNGQSHLTVCKMLNGNVQFVLKVHHKLPSPYHISLHYYVLCNHYIFRLWVSWKK